MATEAQTAGQIGLLTIYDRCKAVDLGMVMGDIRVTKKGGARVLVTSAIRSPMGVEAKQTAPAS